MIRGPGSLNRAASPVRPSTTVNVRRVSPRTQVKAAGTARAASSAVTDSPVVPPIRPMTRTSAPSVCSVRATFSPLPPGRACTAAGRFTPDQFNVRDVMGHVQGGVEADDSDHMNRLFR